MPTNSELGRSPREFGEDMALLPILGLFIGLPPMVFFPREYRDGFIPPTGEEARPEGEGGGRNEEL